MIVRIFRSSTEVSLKLRVPESEKSSLQKKRLISNKGANLKGEIELTKAAK